ncbi:DUF2268 domain-containing protein [Alkalihalobacillus sp. MEB130]|uniref:DUF2268 domain-containing protein n=1 Tax=Alkalihalobacillus sp. MEB130 TaxID=2976704 RepID=UPI0028E05419|nr:DUF2268 domain-containing protein [Alkalihalobacillus sp. MEB130]MDT8859640.1 DUF2268 domain-containing protein [Alkalihalobacillus sp. MEB130]
MGVVRTDKWLFHYKKKWNEAKTMEEKFECQRDLIIEPLSPIFSTKDLLGLHHYLIQMGLFLPDQSIQVEYEKWNETLPWFTIQKQFLKLKEKWDGPDVKIYILPMNQQNHFLKDELGGKTGLSLEKAIILFIDSTTNEKDLLALITHEYHHICRLQSMKENEETVTLLESIVMEGLAEFAVKEELGVESCASWTHRYDHVWSDEWFNRWIRPNLQTKGRKNYLHVLYGSTEQKIPLWLGYYTGYKLIQSATNELDNTVQLLPVKADTFLKKSRFNI